MHWNRFLRLLANENNWRNRKHAASAHCADHRARIEHWSTTHSAQRTYMHTHMNEVVLATSEVF